MAGTLGLVATNRPHAALQASMSWLTPHGPFSSPCKPGAWTSLLPLLSDLRDRPLTQFTPSAPFDAKHIVKLSFEKHQNS